MTKITEASVAKHYRVVGVQDNKSIDLFICGANSSSDSPCRDGRGLCQIIEQFHGMSDFAAYRSNGERRVLLHWLGELDGEVFKAQEAGAHRLELITENEANDLELDGKWVRDILVENCSAVKLYELSLDFALYEEYWGDDEELEFPGALWEFRDEGTLILPDDERFQQLLELEWDYQRATATHKINEKSALLAGAASAGESPAEGAPTATGSARFSEGDYPQLLELLTLKKTITLNCDEPLTEESIDDEDIYVHLGLDENGDAWGNFDCHWLWLSDWRDEKAQQKRYGKKFRTFVQEDGEIGLEFTYLPGPPWGQGEQRETAARIVFEATRLSELMTFEEYLSEVEQEAAWINDLHGEGGETYALIFDVVPAGRRSIVTEDFEAILEKPLWIQRKGKKYNVHVGVYQD